MGQKSLIKFFKRLFSPFSRFRLSKSANIEEQIQHLLDVGEEAGTISELEGEMIQGIFELKDTLVREIMVPRTEMTCIKVGTTLKDIIETIKSKGHSRYPVYEEDLDHIIGILHVKDLISYWEPGHKQFNLKQILRPPYFIPQNMRTSDILREFQNRRFHMAIVTDEYGGTSGLITIEDVLEEIVGDIKDEHDKEETLIHSLDQESILVDARTDIEDLEEYLGIKLPEGQYESVGGFIINLVGRVPSAGEIIDYKDLQFIIEKADQRKIEKVKVKHSNPTLPASSAQ